MLLVTTDYPSPESRHGGGRLCRAWMEQLSRKHGIELLCFGGPEAGIPAGDGIFRRIHAVPPPAPGLRRISRARLAFKYPLSVAANHSPLLADRLRELAARERYDLIQFDNFHMGRYLDFLPDGQRTALCLQDIAGGVLRQIVRISGGPKKIALYREWRKTAWWEKWFCIRAGNVLLMSLKDKRTVDSWDIGVRSFVLPPLLDKEVFRLRSPSGESPEIVFPGAMHRLGNLDAARRLKEKILPAVLAEDPAARVVIAGDRPPRRLRELQSDNFKVAGPFERLDDLYSRPCILAAPLRVAGGIIVKILEAMAAGVPVAASRAANAGIGAPEEEAILVADRDRDFARQVIRLLKDRELRERLREGAGRFLRQRYDPERCRKELDVIYSSCAGETA